ncbi:MAG: phage holin family protein [Opitutaceae bacterium]|nr:phage holin family protein [Opitutaceae bacterium]
MNHPLLQLIWRWAVLAVGVTLASHVVPGIAYDVPRTLLVVVLLLSFFNAVLKPILVIFTLPFIVLTLGLGVVLINALLFLFVGRLVEGFHVQGFWSALGGAVIVSLTNLFLLGLMSGGPPSGRSGPPSKRKGRSEDVIDV